MHLKNDFGLTISILIIIYIAIDKYTFYNEIIINGVQNGLSICDKYHFGLAATKPVFGVSDKVRFKPAFSATATC